MDRAVLTGNENFGGHTIRPAIHEVPAKRKTTCFTNEALKQNRLSDSNTDDSKRKAAILIFFKSEDLLTLICKAGSNRSKHLLIQTATQHAGVLPIKG